MGRLPHKPENLLLTVPARVLLVLDRDPTALFGSIAVRARIDERTVSRTLKQLEVAGYLSRQRRGKTNTYSINHTAPIADLHAGGTVGDLLAVLNPSVNRSEPGRP